MIKAITFDIDGTLYPQWKLMTTSLGFYIKNFNTVRHYWLMRRNLRKDHYNYEADGRPGLLRHQAGMVADLSGRSAEDVEALIDEKVYREWEETFSRIRPLPRVKEVLQGLKQRGYIVAAMSDFPVEKKLEYFGLSDCWDLAITSEDSGYLKPSMVAYKYLSSKLQLEPKEILYVGNSYRNDIIGAKKAGYWAAHFAWRNRRNSLADFHYSNYSQFLPRFEQFLQTAFPE